jgi:hypothetical protein
VAAQVVERLGAAAPLGAKGKPRVILDLSNLSSASQREVLKLLKQNAKVAKRAKDILIHDRANNEMRVFDPKDAP